MQGRASSAVKQHPRRVSLTAGFPGESPSSFLREKDMVFL